MLGICAALLLQAQAPVAQPVELPVSLDRIRTGLARPALFEPPLPRPWRRLVFRVKVEERKPFDGIPWAETWLVPVSARPPMPPAHFEFLQSTTPPEVRGGSASVGAGVNVLPALGAARRFIGKQIRTIQQKRAKREVEAAMRAAGIR